MAEKKADRTIHVVPDAALMGRIVRVLDALTVRAEGAAPKRATVVARALDLGLAELERRLGLAGETAEAAPEADGTATEPRSS